MKKHIFTSFLALALVACGSQADTTATAQDKPSEAVPKKNITVEELGGGFFMLLGPGGNIGVSVGEDGVYIVDDKFAQFGQEIIDTIGGLTDQPIRFVHNTHHHGDHTGANAELRAVGATIIAHDNVYERMSKPFPSTRAESGQSTPTAPNTWPNMTFSENATLHFNGQTVKAIHTPSAHTAGDSIVVFEEANIIHMGDNYFQGMFPFVDIDGGGNVAGMIASHDVALSLADANTKIIPGHGPLSTKADLQKSRDILADVQKRVKDRMAKGETADAIVKAGVLKDYESLNSFINEEAMIRTAYRSLSGN